MRKNRLKKCALKHNAMTDRKFFRVWIYKCAYLGTLHYMGVFADPICHKIHQATADLLKNMSLLLGLNTIFKQLRKLKCCRSLSVLFWRFLIVFIMFLKCFPFFKVFFDDWRVFGDFYLIYSIERIQNRIRLSKILSPDPDPKLIRIHYTLKKGKHFGL